MPKTSTAIAVADTESPFLASFREVAASLMASDQSGDDMALAILNATDIEDILGGGSGAIGLNEMIGEPFTVEKIELRESDYVDGLAAYAVIHAVMDDGEKRIITTGAQTVIAQLIAMHRSGHLPQRCSSTKATKATAAGYFPVQLCKAAAYDPGDHASF